MATLGWVWEEDGNFGRFFSSVLEWVEGGRLHSDFSCLTVQPFMCLAPSVTRHKKGIWVYVKFQPNEYIYKEKNVRGYFCLNQINCMPSWKKIGGSNFVTFWHLMADSNLVFEKFFHKLVASVKCMSIPSFALIGRTESILKPECNLGFGLFRPLTRWPLWIFEKIENQWKCIQKIICGVK